jgi:hypothetical protein
MVKGLSEEATQTRLKAPARILRTECLPASKLCNPILAAVLNDAGVLPQRDTFARPPLDGGLVGGSRYDQVVDVGEVFHDAVAIGIPEVDAIGELHLYRPSLRGIRTDVTHYRLSGPLSRYLLIVAKIKLWKASRHCAGAPQLNPSAPLDSGLSRSERQRFDCGLKPLTQVARSNLHAEADQTLPACFGL